MKGKIMKQHEIPWIGALKDLYSMTSVYFAALNLLLIAITAFATVIGPLLHTPGAFIIYAPWMNIYLFIGCLAVLVLLAMALEYKYIYPSYFAFRNKQEYEHQNLIRGDIKLLMERLARIEKALGIPPVENVGEEKQ